MFNWQKLGKIFDPTELRVAGWMNEFAQAPCSLQFDEFIRFYFSCRPKPDSNGQYVSRCAYVDLSVDGRFDVLNVASKPVLELGARGTFDEFGTYPVSVIRDEHDVGKIHAYFGGWTRCESVPFNVAIGYAVSTDSGVTFEKYGSGPILSYSPDEPFILSGPKIRRYGDVWYLWYIAGRRWKIYKGKPEPIYKIRLATSSDGVNWKKMNRDMVPDQLGEDEAQASPDVIFFQGKYHMFFCYRQASDYRRNPSRSYRIGYAYSDDMLNWTRDDTQVGLDVSSNGWDSEMVAYPHLFELGGQVYMAYLGNQVGRYGFGIARLQGILSQRLRV